MAACSIQTLHHFIYGAWAPIDLLTVGSFSQSSRNNEGQINIDLDSL